MLELPDYAAKKGSGRVLPLHEDHLCTALAAWRAATHAAGPVIHIGAGRADDGTEYRGLVCQRVPRNRPRLVLPKRKSKAD